MSFFKKFKPPYLFAHRGYSSLKLENSIEAFQEAKDKKIPGIELDIQMCKSGELVVFHDKSLKRLSGIHKNIEDITYNQIKAIRIGNSGKIPLLEEVFRTFGTNFYYDIEIKNGKNKKLVVKKLYNLIQKYNLKENIIISSFYPLILREWHKLKTPIPIGLIFEGKGLWPLLRNTIVILISKSDFYKPHHILVSNIFYNPHIKNKTIISWTLDSKIDGKNVINMGAKGIISNDPSIFLYITEKKGQ